MHTSASKSCACVISSIESAITSREMSDARIPGVPCDWLSETAIVLNGSATPPAAATPSPTRAESSRWLRLHGIVPVQAEATPTMGPPSRAGSIPSARKCARAGARSGPDARASRARRRRASSPSIDAVSGLGGLVLDLLPRQLRRLERDREAIDSLALHRVDVEHDAVVRDLVARRGGATEPAEDEAGDRVVVLLRQVDLELLVEVVDRERPADADPVLVEPLDRLVREVELVLDLAHDLLQHVLERDDSLHRAVLVDHDRQVLVGAPKLRQQRAEVLRLGNHVRRADEVRELDGADAALVERLD